MNYDERPIGTHNSNRIMIETTEFVQEQLTEGTLEDRLINKNWKVRSNAYIELASIFSSAEISSEVYIQHQHLLVNYISDCHPVAQESALLALKAYFTKGYALAPPELTSVLIERCLSSSRSNVQSKAMEIIFELGKVDGMIRTVMESISMTKSVKVTLGCLQALRGIIKSYGITSIDLDMLFKIIEKQAMSSTNAQVRAEALEIYKELYKHINDTILPYITKLKPTQQEILKQEFKKVNKDPENNSLIHNTLPTNIQGQFSIEGKHDTILSSIHEDMKWDEKKDKLNEFIELCNTPLVKTINTSEAICLLTNFIRDNNVAVANTALTAMGALYKVIQESYQKSLIHLVIGRYKDKKLIQAVNFCLDGIFYNERLAEALECMKDELLDKSPAIKVQLCKWIEERLAKTFNPSIGKAISEIGFGGVLAKLTEEGIGEIRDAAFGCIGVIKVLYEKCGIEKAFTGTQKLERINKAAEVAKAKWPSILELAKSPIDNIKVMKKTSSKRSSKNDTDKTLKQSIESTRTHSDNTDYEKVLKEKIPVLELITSDNWRERHKGLVQLNEWIKCNTEELKVVIEPLLQFLSNHFKNFKEKNVSILKELLTLFQSFAIYKSRYMIELVIPELLDKIIEPKWAESCLRIMLSVLEIAGTNVVIPKLLAKLSMNPKNPNIIKGMFMFLFKVIEGYTIDSSTMKMIIEGTKEYTTNSNKAIRQLAQEFYSKELMREDIKKPIFNTPVNLMEIMSPQLLVDISDNSIKKRQEAREQLETIISKCGSISSCGLEPLMLALKQRLLDPCKSLCKGFIIILGNLAQAMGEEFKCYSNEVLPELMYNLIDNQPYIRAEAIRTINKIANITGYNIIINELSIILRKANQQTTIELLNWIITHKDNIRKYNCKCLIPVLIECLHNESKEVIEVAQQVVIDIIGKEVFLNEASNRMQYMDDISDIVLPGISEKANRMKKYGEEYYLMELKEECEKSMNSVLVNLMFGQPEDIKRSIKIIIEAIKNNKPIIEVLDILFKWITVLLLNEEIMQDGVKLLREIFLYLLDIKYEMIDYEAKIIFPAIPESLYETDIIKLAFSLYSPIKVWSILMQTLNTENVIIKEKCLSMLCRIVEEYCLDISLSKDIIIIGKVLCRAETEYINNTCIQILLIMYKCKGEAIWSYLGTMPKTVIDQLKAFFAEFSIPVKPFTVLASPKTNLIEVLEILKEDNLDKRIGALARFDEFIENPEKIQEVTINASAIMNTFGSTLCSIFTKPLFDLPVNFLTYFIHVLQKLSSSSLLLQCLTKNEVKMLLDRLLGCLLRDEVATAGQKKEGEAIMKQLNFCILRILENSNPTNILCGLIYLLTKHKTDPSTSKFPGLIVKCILKLTKAIKQILPVLSINEVLMQIHEYLLVTSPLPPFIHPHDELGVRTVKTIINELVKQIKEDIWTHYSSIELHPTKDKHIRRWITLILTNISSSDGELSQIIEELKSPVSFQSGIAKLKDYHASHPQCNLHQVLKVCGPSFSARVLSLLNDSGRTRRAKSISRIRQFRLNPNKGDDKEQSTEGKKAESFGLIQSESASTFK